MVDVDLSILGQNEKRFVEYEAGIRAEYSWVTPDSLNAKRAEILQKFLDRGRIYSTQQFFDKFERQARRNLERSIRRIASRPPAEAQSGSTTSRSVPAAFGGAWPSRSSLIHVACASRIHASATDFPFSA